MSQLLHNLHDKSALSTKHYRELGDKKQECSMLFSARTFTVLLYCFFLSWHSNWFSRRTASFGDDITGQELAALINADSQHGLFRSPGDLVAFLAEPGQYSQPFHLLLLLRLRRATFYEDKQGLRHILSRQDLAVSLCKHFLPSLLTEAAAYPLFVGDLAPYTLLQTPLQKGTSGATGDEDGVKSEEGVSFGYTSTVLMRFRSRRDFVDWLLSVCRDLESGQLQQELDYPLRAYRSLLGSETGARDGAVSDESASVMMAVPLSEATSVLLEVAVAILLPICMLGAYYLLLICSKCVL